MVVLDWIEEREYVDLMEWRHLLTVLDSTGHTHTEGNCYEHKSWSGESGPILLAAQEEAILECCDSTEGSFRVQIMGRKGNSPSR